MEITVDFTMIHQLIILAAVGSSVVVLLGAEQGRGVAQGCVTSPEHSIFIHYYCLRFSQIRLLSAFPTGEPGSIKQLGNEK